MKKCVEILAPAGSYESLKAAIFAGADAVYIGGTRFGARAYADNLSQERMLEAIDYVHLHGRKIYLTVNTLLKDQELKTELYDYLLPYYKQGLDAVIVQDIGVLQFVKEHFPNLPIHASTQMTVTNVLGAKFVEKLGVERVVTAREMQLSEIQEIAENTNLEIESFVHGALCYCYSGQCLYSSLIGGRSGNRGQCAQPCRLPYQVNGAQETQYILSLKDMCTLEYIPELVEAGIDSFKIEGRMKKPEYVALVTAMYRKYVDFYFEVGKEAYHVDAEDRKMLMDLYNRGGSHGGYFHTKNGREMLSLRRPNHAGVPVLRVVGRNGKQIIAKALADIHRGDVIELPDGEENYTFAKDIKKGQTTDFITHRKQIFQKDHVLNRTRNESLLAEIRHEMIDKQLQEKIQGRLVLAVGDVARLRLMCGTVSVEIEGDQVEQAVNQPMEKERIERQMRKTGNTAFTFDELQIEIKGNLFIPLQSLNELRRRGIEALEKAILSTYRREVTTQSVTEGVLESTGQDEMQFAVYVEEVEQWKEALEHNRIKRIYLDCNAVERIWENPFVRDIIDSTHQKEKEIYLAMPHVFRKEAIQIYETAYEVLFTAGWDGVLVRNQESYQFLREHFYEQKIVTDYNIYQFNQYAKQFWQSEGVEATTAPLELNYHELKHLGLAQSELIVYGYYPMMVSAQCVQKTTEGCKHRKGLLKMKDRYRKEFAVRTLCDYCYNIIYNTAPTILTDQKEEILELQPKALRMHFTLEDRERMREMIQLYERVFYRGGDSCEPDIEFTRGHFKRGIK